MGWGKGIKGVMIGGVGEGYKGVTIGGVGEGYERGNDYFYLLHTFL